MALKATYPKLEDIPEQYRDLYTERNGQFELTGVEGVKTQADVERLQTALDKERSDHKATKEKLRPWAEMDHDETMAALDRIPELEATAKGKVDDDAINEMVERRVDAKMKQATGPLERQIEKLTAENTELSTANQEMHAKDRQRTIRDAVRDALTKAKVIPEAHEDALMLAERVFDINDAGEVVTKDQVGFTPGINPEVWATEVQEKRPHWWPASSGGGARGNNGGGGVDNPWSHANWNMTRQGQVITEKGEAFAAQLAKAAGTTVGGPKPAAPAS